MTARRDQSVDGTMSFGDHLEELRKRIFLAIVAPLPISVITFFYSDTLIRWLLVPLYGVLKRNELPQQVQALSPPEVIVAKLKLSIIAALIVASPWVMWQAWKFVSPGLFKHERRFVYFLIPGSALLTTIGVALMYYAMLPLMLQVLVSIGSGVETMTTDLPTDSQVVAAEKSELSIKIVTDVPESPAPGEAWIVWPDMTQAFIAVKDQDGSIEVVPLVGDTQSAITQLFRLKDYIGFVLILFLGIVIAFQMPLVVVLLGWLGLASPHWFRRQRKLALLICGVVSAMITPPDVISMMVMFIPLYGLYELGIILLVIAPASVVSEGQILRLGRSHKKDE